MNEITVNCKNIKQWDWGNTMAQGNRADSIDSNYKIETEKSNDGEGVVHIKKFQQAEEKQTLELSAFEQVMKQMNIADRNDFDDKYTQLWNAASDNQEMLSVIICEIDFFHEYHENYGHQASSFMLLVIALALKTTCEEHDAFLARYKGNEFGILIKGNDASVAADVAEKLRLSVEKSRTEHKYSTVSDVVTLSIGLASVFPTSMQVEMNHTSSALYEAKVSGHNQVSSYLNESTVERNQIVAQSQVEAPKETESDFGLMMQEMGIHNKPSFDGYFDNVWKEATRDQELLSLLICELDFFSEYAEHYGNKEANEMMLVAAIALKAKCEEIGCFFAHLGGARFSILIHGGNATKGLKVSEAVKSTLQALEIEHLASPIKKTTSMSIGLSNIFPSDLNNTKILMSKVEEALTVAKSNGYDQIGVEI